MLYIPVSTFETEAYSTFLSFPFSGLGVTTFRCLYPASRYSQYLRGIYAMLYIPVPPFETKAMANQYSANFFPFLSATGQVER
jgi:hypothetical protein